MLVSGILLGTLSGLAVRRTWRPLAALQIRWLPLLIAGLIARAVAPFVPPAAFALYVTALTATTGVALLNVRLVGALLVALGSALNLVVVVLNGGMPVDAAAVVVAGGTMPGDALHVMLGDAARLAWLADVIPVGLFRAVYSLGDICIAVGGFIVPFVLLVRR